MPRLTLDVPESQIVELVRALPAESKQAVLRALIPDLDEIEKLVDYGSARVRDVCARRGVDWERLSEVERQRLVDDLLHEG